MNLTRIIFNNPQLCYALDSLAWAAALILHRLGYCTESIWEEYEAWALVNGVELVKLPRTKWEERWLPSWLFRIEIRPYRPERNL